MNIDEMQKINAARATRWHKGGDWSLLEWMGALCGEAGEGANVAKKIKRIEDKLENIKVNMIMNSPEDLEGYKQDLAAEIGDVFLYGLIVLSKLDVKASDVLRQVFDNKSIEYGFPERAPQETRFTGDV